MMRLITRRPARRRMANMQTIDGLRDTLEDLEKQLSKAEERYQTLRRRHAAVQNALTELDA